MAKDPRKDEFPDIPHQREGARPDFSKPLPPAKLPKELQETLDNDERMWEVLYEGRAQESTDSSLRYAAYGSRIRTILMSAHRYVAYTSDIGESFRPVAHPWLVRSAYGISWLYVGGDVAYEGYKAYLRNQRILHPEKVEGESVMQKAKDAVSGSLGGGSGSGSGSAVQTTLMKLNEPDARQELSVGHDKRVPIVEDYRAVMVQRGIFQAVASMGLPAFTIHSVVKYSGRALKNNKNLKIRTWGPIGLGLAVVPALPYLFDKPVEHALEWGFHRTFEAIWGEEAVHGRPVTGKKELRHAESIAGARKEKEL